MGRIRIDIGQLRGLGPGRGMGQVLVPGSEQGSGQERERRSWKKSCCTVVKTRRLLLPRPVLIFPSVCSL
jgi:hypothetical protein